MMKIHKNYYMYINEFLKNPGSYSTTSNWDYIYISCIDQQKDPW